MIPQLYPPAKLEPDADLAKRLGLTVHVSSHFMDIRKNDLVLRLSHRHRVYFHDIVTCFDFYAGAVVPVEVDGIKLVDYSTPRWHDVVGYANHPIFFPSLAEPMATTRQYIELADLKDGDVVFDLGAYVGLTALNFARIGGVVIAVEPDEENIKALWKNMHMSLCAGGPGYSISNAAVWNHNDGIEFSNEGNMGSSAIGMVGSGRGNITKVKTMTLSQLADGLPRVDFIKCDVEGAETVIFQDDAFFAKHRPHILIEIHEIKGVSCMAEVKGQIEARGYQCREVDQVGVGLKLLDCRA